MDNEELSLDELDALREAVNIGSGAAATTVSEILDASTRITVPEISVCRIRELPLKELEPVFGVEIEYIDGLRGKTLLLLKQSDVQGIVCRMMGTSAEGDFVLDEMTESCIREFMNQMMGSSATALAEILQRPTNITAPRSFKVRDTDSLGQMYFGSADETAAVVRLAITVEGTLDGSFFQVMPLPFAKSLADTLLYGPEETAPGEAGAVDEEISPAVPPQAAPAPSPQPAAPTFAAPLADTGAPPQTAAAAAPRESAPRRHRAAEPENLELLLDVPLEATVEIGRARRKVTEVLTYGKDDLIVLDRRVGEPVDLFVGGVLVAKGTVVVLDENFGFRVDKIYSHPWLHRGPSESGRQDRQEDHIYIFGGD